MLLGYARVSTTEQNLNLQLDALNQYGCDEIFSDTISGVKEDRDGLTKLLHYARENDKIVVWRLDRLGRTLKQLIQIIEDLQAKNIAFVSLTEQIDTSTHTGKLIFHIFGALAEFERNLIRERSQAGREAARKRGIKGGRPFTISVAKKRAIKTMYVNNQANVKTICNVHNISKSTLYRILKSDL